MLASLPDVLSEICLLQDLAFRGHDSKGKALAVDIDPKDILPSGLINIGLGKKRDDLQVGSQTKCLARPPAPEQTGESVPVPIRPDGDGDPSSGVKAEFDEVERLGLERLAVAGDVELHGHSLDARASLLLPPSASCEVADRLNVEPRQLLGFGTDAAPEVVELPVVASFRKKSVRFRSSNLLKGREGILFMGSRVCLKKDCPLHSPNQQKKNTKNYLSAATSLLPPVNGVGFRSGE